MYIFGPLNKQPLHMQLIDFVKTNELLSVLSGQLSASLNRHLNRKFRTAGLAITTEQWLVLMCLWNKDGQTQQSLSDQTSKDKTSITRLLILSQKIVLWKDTLTLQTEELTKSTLLIREERWRTML